VPPFKVEILHFEADEDAEAWCWIGARPVSERNMMD